MGGSNLSMGKRGLLGLILCRLFAGEGVLVCSWVDLSRLYSMTMAHFCIISTNDRINSFCSSRLFTLVWSPTYTRYALTWSTFIELGHHWNPHGFIGLLLSISVLDFEWMHFKVVIWLLRWVLGMTAKVHRVCGSFPPSFGSMVRNGNFDLSVTPNCEQRLLDEFPSVWAMQWIAGILESYAI